MESTDSENSSDFPSTRSSSKTTLRQPSDGVRIDADLTKRLAERIQNYKYTDKEKRAITNASAQTALGGAFGLGGGVWASREVGVIGTSVYAGLLVGGLFGVMTLASGFRDSEMLKMVKELIEEERKRRMGGGSAPRVEVGEVSWPSQSDAHSTVGTPSVDRNPTPPWLRAGATRASPLEGVRTNGSMDDFAPTSRIDATQPTMNDFPRSTDDFMGGGSSTQPTSGKRQRINQYGDVVEESALKVLDSETKELKAGGHDIRFRANLHAQLSREFATVLQKYRDTEERYRGLYRARIARQIRVVNASASDEDVERMVDTGGPVFEQGLSGKSLLEVKAAYDDAVGRMEDLMKLESTVQELFVIFTDLVELIDSQDALVQDIAVNIEIGAPGIEEANLELQKGSKHALTARRMKIAI
ncbi:Syntaxin-1A, partial [Gonapodya sp. JEL0774]